MDTDVHSPAFIRADSLKAVGKDGQKGTSVKQVRRFSRTGIIGLTILTAMTAGATSLISKLVTPQAVTAVSVIAGFLILCFIVRGILQVTFTLLRYMFWTAVICAILLCTL